MSKKTSLQDISWFGKDFRLIFLVIFLIELFSFLAHWLGQFWNIGDVITLIVGLFILGIIIYRFEYGLLAAFIELIIGSQGHYFDYLVSGQVISIRIIIFTIIMLVFCYKLFTDKAACNIIFKILKSKWILLLGLCLAWGIVTALIHHNQLRNIINDFNAWIFFLYVFPAVYILQNHKYRDQIWTVFCASITAVALKSLFFLYVFSHKFNNLISYLYDWGRDTRWGEFTLVSGGLFRIFSQAQIYSLIGLLVLLGYVFYKGRLDYQNKENRYIFIVICLQLATVILGLSRSNWVGLIAALFLAILFALFYFKYRIIDTITLLLRTFLCFVVSVIIIFVVLFFPFPQQTVFNASAALNERFSIQDKAGASRWNQLPELFKAISIHPVIGSGWGATITYESRDPRITTIENPKGIYTTYAFEWGYLDIILKIGLLGLVIYLLFISKILRSLIQLTKNKKERFQNALICGLILGLFSLICTHIFSPYLNHPLGIGYLLILFAIVETQTYTNIEPIKS